MISDFKSLDAKKGDVVDFVTCESPKIENESSKTSQIQRFKPAKHGLFAIFNEAKLDGRTRLGKTVRFLRKELTKHCGGNPSISERILIDRIIQKTIKCHLYEMGLLGNPGQGAKDHYLALANSLRHDLQALGIKKRADGYMGLKDYLERRQSEHHRSDPG